MNKYVVGFLIDPILRESVFIIKNKPKWQEGLMNGVGGKIEERDVNPQAAMAREFEEETGFLLKYWECFCIITGSDQDYQPYALWFFYAMMTNLHGRVKSMESEEVVIEKIDKITTENAIPNLVWLLPMALSMEKSNWVDRYHINEMKA